MSISNRMTKNEDTREAEGRIYEVGYLLVPSLSPESVSKESNKIRELVKKHGGVIVTDEEPKLRELSYPIEKVVTHKKEIFTSAYFGWIKFEMEGENVIALEKELQKEETILRFLLISTVRENTIAARRPIVRTGETARRREPKGVQMSDEEIEKTIAELVKE